LTPPIRHALMLAGLTLALAGCGSGPPVRTYRLGDAGPLATGVGSDAGRPILELRTVSVPDYLDSSDIQRDTGPNELTASPTGRWAERLSLGLTHALAVDLSTRLPGDVITTDAGVEPAHRLFVDIERAEISTDGTCVLAARWRVSPGHGDAIEASEHGVFRESAGSGDDAAVAAAMTRAVERLADQIAATMRQTPARGK
jgi:uncharacterized lipoprotein YmbA